MSIVLLSAHRGRSPLLQRQFLREANDVCAGCYHVTLTGGLAAGRLYRFSAEPSFQWVCASTDVAW